MIYLYILNANVFQGAQNGISEISTVLEILELGDCYSHTTRKRSLRPFLACDYLEVLRN